VRIGSIEVAGAIEADLRFRAKCLTDIRISGYYAAADWLEHSEDVIKKLKE
jgi:hypothetical protein